MPNPKMYLKPRVDFATTAVPGRRYSIPARGDGVLQEGWLYYDRLADLYSQGNLQLQYLMPNQTLEYGAQSPPLVCAINAGRLKGFIPRPFLRQAPQVTTLAKSLILPEPGNWDADYLQHVYGFTPGDRTHVAEVGDAQAYDYLTYWDIVQSADGFLKMTQKGTVTLADAYRFSRVDVGVTTPTSLTTSVDDPYGDQDPGAFLGVCPDPFFVAGFSRQSPDAAALAYFLAQMQVGTMLFRYCTEIVWGSGTWMLACPPQGKPVLYRNANYLPADNWWAFMQPPLWTPCKWDHGDLSEITPTTAAAGGYTYHIGVIDGCVCVAEGGWDGQIAYFDAAKAGWPGEPVVPAGGAWIQNFPGQCTFWLDFPQFPVGALGRGQFWTGDNDLTLVDADVWGAPGDVTRNVNRTPPTVVVAIPGITDNNADIDVYRVPDYPDYLYYVLKMRPGWHTTLDRSDMSGGLPSLMTYTAPFVEAVTVWQSTTLTDNGEPDFADAVEIVPQGLSSEEELEGCRAQSHEFRAYNGQPGFVPPDGMAVPPQGLPRSFLLNPGAQVKVEENWMMRDVVTGEVSQGDTVDVGQFTIVRAERDKLEWSGDATDLLGLAALGRWSRDELNFRGWYLTDALAFICDLLAIGPAQRDFEDLDNAAVVLPTDDSASWKANASFADIMVDMVKRYGQGAVLYYDGTDNTLKTGCRYCRTKRTSDNWQTHQDNGWNSSGCLAADLTRNTSGLSDGVDVHVIDDPDSTGVTAIMAAAVALGPVASDVIFTTKPVRVKTSSLQREGYANELIAKATGPTGLPLQARWRNSEAFDLTNPHSEYIGVRVTGTVLDLGASDKDGNGWTQEAVNDKLAEVAMCVKDGLAGEVEVELALHAEIRVGWVLMLHGGAYGAVDQKHFRITAGRHRVGEMVTVLEGHEMETVLYES
jgi:hypothetical protein